MARRKMGNVGRVGKMVGVFCSHAGPAAIAEVAPQVYGFTLRTTAHPRKLNEDASKVLALLHFRFGLDRLRSVQLKWKQIGTVVVTCCFADAIERVPSDMRPSAIAALYVRDALAGGAIVDEYALGDQSVRRALSALLHGLFEFLVQSQGRYALVLSRADEVAGVPVFYRHYLYSYADGALVEAPESPPAAGE